MRPELRATLAFLEVMTLRPEELTAADAESVYAAGVSSRGLRDAVAVCTLFSMITRLADSFGWDVPSWEMQLARAADRLERSYLLPV